MANILLCCSASAREDHVRVWQAQGYAPAALAVEKLDGLGVEFAAWRFNLRMSNTEPVVRLNVESRGDRPLMEAKTAELLKLIDG